MDRWEKCTGRMILAFLVAFIVALLLVNLMFLWLKANPS